MTGCTTMEESTTSEAGRCPLERRVRPTLVDVGAASLEAEAARKRRAEARTALRKLRIKWQDETGEWYDRDECRGTDGADEMEAAVEARKLANAAYRAAYSKLRRVIGAYWARPNE